jgi:type IV/VI secretion system ImpK/VasF family protein
MSGDDLDKTHARMEQRKADSGARPRPTAQTPGGGVRNPGSGESPRPRPPVPTPGSGARPRPAAPTPGSGARQYPSPGSGARPMPRANQGSGARPFPSANQGSGARAFPSGSQGSGARPRPAPPSNLPHIGDDEHASALPASVSRSQAMVTDDRSRLMVTDDRSRMMMRNDRSRAIARAATSVARRNNFDVWQELVATSREAADVIESVTPVAAANDLDAMRPVLGPETLDALHSRLRETLARLTGQLSHQLTTAEIKEVLFILAIVFDEKVQRRLAPDEEHQWPLLQRALLDVHDGGDLFYDFIDDRLQRVDASPLMFELCYFCLSDGFVGRHNRNKQKIEDYKRKLSMRVAGTAPSGPEEMTTAWQPPVTGGPLRFYLATAAFVLLLPLALLWLW